MLECKEDADEVREVVIGSFVKEPGGFLECLLAEFWYTCHNIHSESAVLFVPVIGHGACSECIFVVLKRPFEIRLFVLIAPEACKGEV